MREDEYDPLPMRVRFGPPESSRSVSHYREPKPKPERKTKAVWKVNESQFKAMAEMVRKGASEYATADAFGVSRSTVQRAKRLYL
jgi:hypothetical protein